MNSGAGPNAAATAYLMGTAGSVILERDLPTNLCRFASQRWETTNPCRRLISSPTRSIWAAVLWELRSVLEGSDQLGLHRATRQLLAHLLRVPIAFGHPY